MKLFKAFLLAALICAILSIQYLYQGYMKDAFAVGILSVVAVGIAYVFWRRRDMKRRLCLDLAVQRALDHSKARGHVALDSEEAFAYFQEIAGKDGVGDPDLDGHDAAVLKKALAGYATIVGQFGYAPSSYYKNRVIRPR